MNKHFAIIVVLVCVGFFVTLGKKSFNLASDFNVYYKTSERIKDKNWEKIYTFEDKEFPFQYSPPTLLVFQYLIFLEQSNSRLLWLFSQSLMFLVGIWFCFKVVEKLNLKNGSIGVLICFIMIYRYFLDALSSGQIFGLLFMVFALLYYFISIKKNQKIIYLSLVAAFIKIGPVVLILSEILKNKKAHWKNIRNSILFTFCVVVVSAILFSKINDQDIFALNSLLYEKWMKICLAGQQYFDGAVLKNQSIRGCLLRMMQDRDIAQKTWMTCSALILSAHCFILLKFNIKDNKCLFLTMSLIVFMLIMPESLPYQQVNAFFPLLMMFTITNNSYQKIKNLLLLLFVLTCSLSSVDIVGVEFSNTMLKYSPFVLFIAFAYFYFLKIAQLENAEAN